MSAPTLDQVRVLETLELLQKDFDGHLGVGAFRLPDDAVCAGVKNVPVGGLTGGQGALLVVLGCLQKRCSSFLTR